MKGKRWKCETCGGYQLKRKRLYRRFCCENCALEGDTKLWMEKEEKKLAEIFENDSKEEIMSKLPHRSWHSILVRAKRLGLSRIGERIWTEEEDEYLVGNYQTGYREEILSSLRGRSWDAIVIHAGKLKLSREVVQSTGNLEKLLNGSLEAYYWSGFLMADGHFSGKRIVLSISKKDKGHLARYKKFIEYNGRMTPYKENLRVACMDSKVVPKVMSFLMARSNKTYEPPDELPMGNRDQILAFIVGFIDGDGSIGKGDNRNFANIRVKLHRSWLEVLKKMADIVYKSAECTSGTPRINNDGYAVWEISNSEVCNFFRRWLNSVELPILQRKWNLVQIYESRSVRARKIHPKVVEMASSGMTCKEISNKLNLTYGMVYNIIKRNSQRNG